MKTYEMLCPCCGQPLVIHITDDGKVIVEYTDKHNDISLSEVRELGYEFGVDIKG